MVILWYLTLILFGNQNIIHKLITQIHVSKIDDS